MIREDTQAKKAAKTVSVIPFYTMSLAMVGTVKAGKAVTVTAHTANELVRTNRAALAPSADEAKAKAEAEAKAKAEAEAKGKGGGK